MKYNLLLASILFAFLTSAQNIAPQPMTQCFEITPTTNQGVTPIINAFECIKTVPMVGADVTIDKTYDQIFKATDHIHIQPATNISAPNNSIKHFKIESNGNEKVVWYEPATVGQVGIYEKMEFGIRLSLLYEAAINDFVNNTPNTSHLNPFDPDRVNIYADIQAPQSSPTTPSRVYGFYYQPKKVSALDTWEPDTTSFAWRFRYSPTQLGTHTVNIRVIIDGIVSNYQTFYFNVINSSHKGYLTVANFGDERDRYLRYSSDNSVYFGIAQNVAHSNYNKHLLPSESNQHKQYISAFASQGVNLTRVELGPHNGLPNYYKYDNYMEAMHSMYAMDGFFRTCELNGVYIGMFRHHTEIMDLPGLAWSEVGFNFNPFITQLNLNAETYFTDPVAIKWHKACQRYILARWGYSMNLLYFGFSEVENWTEELSIQKTGNADLEDSWNQVMPIFENWVNTMEGEKYSNPYYRRILNCHSYATEPKQEINQKSNNLLTGHCDIIGLHKYTNTKHGNHEKLEHIEDRLKKINKNSTKPYLIEEMGFTIIKEGEANGQDFNSDAVDLYCIDQTGTNFKSNIWGTSFMGGIGCGMHWWWDRGIFDHNLYNSYQNLTSFIGSTDLYSQGFSVQDWRDRNYSDFGDSLYVIETFYMVSDDKERAYGWVNNATFFWRNYYNFNPNIQALVDQGYTSAPVCTYSDGHEVDGDPIYNGFGDPIFADKYSDLGPYLADKMVIKKLKKSNPVPFSQKHTYRVEFYKTDETDFNMGNADLVVIAQSDVLGRLTLKNNDFPVLAGDPTGYLYKDRVYKVHYLGKQNSNYFSFGNDSIKENTLDKNNHHNYIREDEAETSIWPNPVTDLININTNKDLYSVIITDINGRLVYNRTIDIENALSINISNFESGLYFVKLVFKNGTSQTHKVVKE
jgi:hypothetical protein